MTKMNCTWFAGLAAFSMCLGGILGWSAAQRGCRNKVVGENNAASLIIVKALAQIREGRTNDALLVLETALDMNVSYAWEQNPSSAETTNMLSIIKRYRSQFPAFTDSLRSNGSPVLRERNEKANSILLNLSQQ